MSTGPAAPPVQGPALRVSGVHHVAIIASDYARSRRFYVNGFGWKPVFENEEIIFYQMNGLVLGTWLKARLEDDMQRAAAGGPVRERCSARR